MQSGESADTPQENASSEAAYVLREAISDIPLSADGQEHDVFITCAEYWDGNLYIGTSNAELLHFVSIPSDDSGDSTQPSFILASRTEPAFTAKQDSPYHLPGVEQLLILPSVSKARVLCNGTLTFYSLPEFSPAFGGKIKQGDCTWVGGIDRNIEDVEDSGDEEAAVIVICLKQRLRLIRIGEQARKIRDIDLGGCLNIQRRGDLACVADGKSYALLDVVNQQKIDLFPISSVSEIDQRSESPAADARPSVARPSSRSFSSRSPIRPLDLRGHERISSLGSQPRNTDKLMPHSPPGWPDRRSSRSLTPSSLSREAGPASPSIDRPLSTTPTPARPERPKNNPPLIPHIATPTPNEFLLTTETALDEPGVGIFVNLDGDVVRGTIEFDSYPESLVVDSLQNGSTATSLPDLSATDGYVIAVTKSRQTSEAVLQIQRLDTSASDHENSKFQLAIPSQVTQPADRSIPIILRESTTSYSFNLPHITKALSLRRLHLSNASDEVQQADAKRSEEEDKLFSRFAGISVGVLLYRGSHLWWVMQNPLLLQLDSVLNGAISSDGFISRQRVEQTFNSLRGREATSELDFFTLNYIRQKAALLLFLDLIIKTSQQTIASEGDKRYTQDALIASDIEPRVVLSITPVLQTEVREGPQGMWVSGGLNSVLNLLKASADYQRDALDVRGPSVDNLLQPLKHFLLAWRRKKGFGSIADEQHVFQTVDAALLHLLLLLDQDSSRGPATAGSLRAELNDVVDRGVDCFDRAVELLEQHQRLYLLSRLYQSRKSVAQVLATWKRILEGDIDKGGELIDGENDVRKYLARIKDVGLVKEYGTWLANRNPKLGVQVFADDNSRVKFSPAEAVGLLKDKAPTAVKDYLEHLVFGKNLVQYVNDLITFYLDTVLSAVSSSAEARDILVASYDTYRALHPPKPLYRQFITDNALDAEWFRNRLRLLQLIGGSHDAASRYDVSALAKRLEPFSDALVPEMIILNGRRGQHEEALRLLTQGLGDYDTAIRYCLLGGSSIFHPSSGMLPSTSLPSKEEQEKLFAHLLHEFMRIEDEDPRRERTTELLDRFGAWFDIGDVLAMIPDDWSVDTLGGFIVHALRRLIRERNETVVVRALVSAQNLRTSVDVVEKIEKIGARFVDTDEVEGGELGRSAGTVDSGFHSMGSGQDGS